MRSNPGLALAAFLLLAVWGAVATRFGLPTPDAVVTSITCSQLVDGHWVAASCSKRSDAPAAQQAPDAPVVVPDTDCGAAGIDAVLATIRELESGGRYAIGPNKGGASGAYQFIQGTWDGVAKRAGRSDLVGQGPWKASPVDQDALARVLVDEAMGGTGDVTRVPVVWYIGHVPVGREWDVVPHPEAGNRLTPRQYLQKWMTVYERMGAPCGGVPA